MSIFFAVTVVCGSPLPLLACISNPSDSFKLLGVHITKDPPWVIHCDYVIKKANRRLYTLRNLKKSGVHPDDVVIVYCWLVRSVLEYGAAAFSNLSNYLANDMENIQKCALSIIYPFTSCKDALAKTGITSFKQSCENACVNVKKRVSPENPTFSLIQVELFNHLWLAVNVQIDHLSPYHLILIFALILYKCLLLYCTSQIFSSSCWWDKCLYMVW